MPVMPPDPDTVAAMTEPDDDDDEGEGEGAPTPKKKVTEVGLHPAIQRFVDARYGGDVEAFVSGLYEQGNSIAALNKRIEELVASQQSPEKREEQLKEMAESDEEYQALKQEIQDLGAESQAIAEEQGRLVTRAVALDREISGLEGEIRPAEDDDKASLKAEIEAKKAGRDS